MFGLFITLVGFIKSIILTTTKTVLQKVDFSALKRGSVGTQKLTNKQRAMVAVEYTKALVLVIVGIIVALFELFPLFMLVMLMLLIIIIVIIFVIVVMQLKSLLDLNIENYTLPTDEMGMSNACIRPMGTNFALQFTEEELARSGGALSNYEKNIYKVGILSRQTIDGYDGTELAKGASTREQKIKFLIGKISIESSMKFYDNDQTSTKDIFKDPVAQGNNGAGYAFAGISVSKGLHDYYSGSTANLIKAKYNYTGGLSYTAKYAPWGIAMAGKHFTNNINEVMGHSNWLAIIDKVASDFGIVASKEEFKAFVIPALGQVKYHTGNKYGTSASHGYANEIEGYVYFWGAMFAMTSDNDAERTWNAWTIHETTPNTNYTEASIRKIFISDDGISDSNRASTPLDFKMPSNPVNRIALNGVPLTDTVWKVVWQKYSDNAGVQKSWATMRAFSKVETFRHLNFHYGFNSFLQGNRVIANLQQKMGVIATTDNVSTLECSPQGGSTFGTGVFKGQKGKTFGTVDGEDFKTWLTEGGGKREYTAHKAWYDKMLAQSGYATSQDKDSTDKTYGKTFKYHMGVPYYNQDTTAAYNGMNYAPSGGSFYRYGCAVYSMAFCATLATGKVINPAEMAMIAQATGQQSDSGISSDQFMDDTFRRMGIEAGFMGNSLSKEENMKRILAELEKGDRVVIFRTGDIRWSSGTNHYMVFTGVVNQNGQKYMTIYSSVPSHGNDTLYSLAEVKARIGAVRLGQPNQGNATWVKYK